MSLSRHQNIIGGARVLPNAITAAGIWNLGEVAFYRNQYSTGNVNTTWPTSMIRRGLIGYWDANNPNSYPGTGTTWSDLSGNNYTGTLTNGPTYNSSNGGSIVFDGSNDYVDTLYTGNTGNNFTIAAWCYPTAVGGSEGSDIVVKSYAATQPYGSYGFEWLSTSKFRYGIANNLTATTYTGATACAINNFYYVVSTFGGDTSDKTLRGYLNINGIMTLDANTAGAALANNPAYNTQPLQIGAFTLGGAGNYFTGRIHIVQLYNVTLTVAEIQTNFDAMRGRFGI